LEGAEVTEQHDRRNPVVSSLLLHGVLFVAFLGAFIILATNMGPTLRTNRTVFILSLFAAAVVAMAALIVGVALYVKSKEAGRMNAVRKLHPDRRALQAYWSGALMQAFLKPGRWLVGANFRGFGVTITVSDRGLEMWRGSARQLVSLGEMRWTSVTAVQPETIHAVIGKKEMPALALGTDGTSAVYQSQIQLFLCTDTGTSIRDAELVGAKVEQLASKWRDASDASSHPS
jgi:hypothetical protein